MKIKKETINISIYILIIILILLPIDSALTGLIGNISIIDYLIVLFLIVHICCNYNNIVCKFKGHFLIYAPLLYAVITILWSPNFGSKSNLMYLSYLFFFFILYNTKFKNKEKIFLTKAIYGSIFLLFFIVLVFGEFYEGRLSLDINGYIDPNYFCTGFIIIIGLLLYLICYKKNKLLNLILLCLLLAIVILSGSRGALLAIIFELISFILFYYRKHFFKILFAFIIIFTVFFILALILPKHILDRYNIFVSLTTDGGSGRLTIWKNMFGIYGEGNIFTEIFGYGREACVYLYYQKFGINYSPHNLFIKILLEMGIVGFILTTIAIFYVLRIILKQKSATLFSILVGICVGALFLDMDNTRVIWLIILILSKDNLFLSKNHTIEVKKFK